jgi:hypothetical protein
MVAAWKHKCLALTSKPMALSCVIKTNEIGTWLEAAPMSEASDPLNRIILEALEEDPHQVGFALERVLERLRAEGLYSVDELEAAAAELFRELGISRTTN